MGVCTSNATGYDLAAAPRSLATFVFGRGPDNPMSPSHLPQELVDLIVDNLRDDIPSLKSCSLAARTFSSPIYSAQ